MTRWQACRRWFESEEGASAVEYALLVGLMSVVVIVAVTALGERLRDVFNEVAEALKP
ncbi:MAG: Flp family type IVb pilin [Nitrospirales bacterium]|nr:Flp family type IVb pilin [Nitrospirales bacterium]